jgi:hypothetical protein
MRLLLHKTDVELREREDEGATWALIGDKGFQGLQHSIRCHLPFKKPRNRPLTQAEEDQNRELAVARVICENFYGRLQSKFEIVSKKFCLGKDNYGFIFDLCVALCNFHIDGHPLRRSIGKYGISY